MDARELEHLYDEHAGAAYAFALRLSGDPALAEDLLQSVFCTLARKTRLWLFNPRSFLLKCVHRSWVDTVRRQKALERAVHAFTQDPFHEPSSASTPGDAASEADATFAQLMDGVRALPEDQRAVLHLKVWEDQTFAQIAATLGISVNTAASRYRYALGKLRSLIPEEVQP